MKPKSNLEGRNLTIHVTQDTIRRARILAAREGTSISGLVSKTLERLADEDARYEAARMRAMVLLEKGWPLGGKIRATREELHDR